jgi:hypothetical protein
MFKGKVSIDGQEDNVTLACLVDIKEFDSDRSILLRFDDGTGTAGTAKNPQLVNGEFLTIL